MLYFNFHLSNGKRQMTQLFFYKIKLHEKKFIEGDYNKEDLKDIATPKKGKIN